MWSMGSVAVAHRLSCSAAYGIFPEQGWNPCPLHWQVDSQPLECQGRPRVCFCFLHNFIYVFTFGCVGSSLLPRFFSSCNAQASHWGGFSCCGPRTLTHSSVQFSCSVMSNFLWPQGLQHTKPHCPSPTPRVHSNPCPLSWWGHPTILSSVVPFSSCPQSFSASGSFQMSPLHIRWPKYWSFSFTISPSNEHPSNEHLISFRMDWLDLLAV